MEPVDPPDSDSSQRVSVIGSFQGEKTGSAGMRVFSEEVGQFQGDFNGGRTIVGIEDPPEISRGSSSELFRQPDASLMGEPQKGGVGDLIQLFHDGTVDCGMAMAQKIDPEGGCPVEVGMPPVIENPGAFSSCNDHWSVLFPFADGCERVENPGFIQIPQISGRFGGERVWRVMFEKGVGYVCHLK